jgi:polyisoprenoid-binding protein YceI
MKRLKQIIVVSVLGLALIVGFAAYAVFKTPAEASAPIQAIPLAESATATPSTTGATSAGSAATTDASATTGSQPASDATASDASTLPASVVTFQIAQEESEARFIIDEVLNDAPKTVIGATDQVAGELAIDPEDPTQTRVGIIQVNARDLTTDNDFRNRAVKNQILQTDQYEFITFTPTEIVGLPESSAVGEPYTFQMVGDLTIRDVTKQVTFEVTATASTEERIEGTATTTLAYADYGITIPQVRQVAGVSDQVRLELDFVALTA